MERVWKNQRTKPNSPQGAYLREDGNTPIDVHPTAMPAIVQVFLAAQGVPVFNPADTNAVTFRANLRTCGTMIRSRVSGRRTWTEAEMQTAFQTGFCAVATWRTLKAMREWLKTPKHAVKTVNVDEVLKVVENYIPSFRALAENTPVLPGFHKDLDKIAYYPATDKRPGIVVVMNQFMVNDFGTEGAFDLAYIDYDFDNPLLEQQLSQWLNQLSGDLTPEVSQAAADIRTVAASTCYRDKESVLANHMPLARWLQHMTAGFVENTGESITDQGYWVVKDLSARDTALALSQLENDFSNVTQPFWADTSDGIPYEYLTGQARNYLSVEISGSEVAIVSANVESSYVFVKANFYTATNAFEESVLQDVEVGDTETTEMEAMVASAQLLGLKMRKDFGASRQVNGSLLTGQYYSAFIPDYDDYMYPLTVRTIIRDLALDVIDYLSSPEAFGIRNSDNPRGKKWKQSDSERDTRRRDVTNSDSDQR